MAYCWIPIFLTDKVDKWSIPTVEQLALHEVDRDLNVTANAAMLKRAPLLMPGWAES